MKNTDNALRSQALLLTMKALDIISKALDIIAADDAANVDTPTDAPADTPTERKINEFQFRNRMLLRSVMLKHGFKPVDTEWWHFTLENEPYPDTYFDYPVR